MDNIENIIRDYFTAYFQLESLIQEKAKGDWNKAGILLNNNEQVQQIWERVEIALKNFRNLTCDVGFMQVNEQYHSLYSILKRLPGVQKNYTDIAGFLEHFRDEWEWKIEEGHIEDGDLLDALDAFFRLPNYDPDGWLKRKFMIGGVIIVDNNKKLPIKVETSFREACTAFLYGLNLAAISVSRSVLESVLKDCFPEFANEGLGGFLHNSWFKIEKLQKNSDLNKKALRIMRAGNQAMHETTEAKISRLLNELYARTVIQDLREIIEFLYH